MYSKLLKGLLLGIGLMLASYSSGSAVPLYKYQIKKVAGSWQEYNGATLYNDFTPPGAIEGDQTRTQLLALPFSFPFDSANYNSVCVTSNGTVTLGRQSTTYDYSYQPGSSDAECVLGVLCADLDNGDFPAVENKITAGVQNINGNQAYVIQWKNTYFYTKTQYFSFQVRLYASGIIEYVYGPGFTGLTSIYGSPRISIT
jgi:hypothetical protein